MGKLGCNTYVVIMTNEKIVEEILYKAHQLGIGDEIFNAATQLIETGGFDKVTAFENAFIFLTNRDK